MSQENEECGGGGGGGILTPWEQQCADEVDNEPEMTEGEHGDLDAYSQQLWHHFQASADAISHLYKDRDSGISIWEKFQHAAGAATALYKEGLASQRRVFDTGVDVGRRRRNKELIQWVRHRRRHIRRDELLSFLCDKPPPPPSARLGAGSRQLVSGVPAGADALALQGLSGALSDINFGFSTTGPPAAGAGSRPRTPGSPSLRAASGRHHHHHMGRQSPPGSNGAVHAVVAAAAGGGVVAGDGHHHVTHVHHHHHLHNSIFLHHHHHSRKRSASSSGGGVGVPNAGVDGGYSPGGGVGGGDVKRFKFNP